MAWGRLKEEFAPLNLKRVRGVWRAEGLHLRPRKSKRIRGAKKPDLAALRPGHVWCLDFCHDSFAGGNRFKCLVVPGGFTRECLAMEVARRIPAERVVDALRLAIADRGAPGHLRCDNGPEFVSWTVKFFLQEHGVRHVTIQPGSPWQNGFAESALEIDVLREVASKNSWEPLRNGRGPG